MCVQKQLCTPKFVRYWVFLVVQNVSALTWLDDQQLATRKTHAGTNPRVFISGWCTLNWSSRQENEPVKQKQKVVVVKILLRIGRTSTICRTVAFVIIVNDNIAKLSYLQHQKVLALKNVFRWIFLLCSIHVLLQAGCDIVQIWHPFMSSCARTLAGWLTNHCWTIWSRPMKQSWKS